MSIGNLVFYVGITTRPTSRYRDHYHDCLSKCYSIARYCFEDRGEFISMNLIDCAINKFDGLEIEQHYIRELSKEYYLINHENWHTDIKRRIPYTPKINTFPYLRHINKNIEKQRKLLLWQKQLIQIHG